MSSANDNLSFTSLQICFPSRRRVYAPRSCRRRNETYLDGSQDRLPRILSLQIPNIRVRLPEYMEVVEAEGHYRVLDSPSVPDLDLMLLERDHSLAHAGTLQIFISHQVSCTPCYHSGSSGITIPAASQTQTRETHRTHV